MASSEASPGAREETARARLTEVERSRPWESMQDVAAAAMARHYDVVVSAMHDHGAARLSRVGEDGMLAVFGSTASAATAALAVQRGLAADLARAGHVLEIGHVGLGA
jgi:class 3 adenylate cyclase